LLGFQAGRSIEAKTTKISRESNSLYYDISIALEQMRRSVDGLYNRCYYYCTMPPPMTGKMLAVCRSSMQAVILLLAAAGPSSQQHEYGVK
jgi:hypothetical protein